MARPGRTRRRLVVGGVVVVVVAAATTSAIALTNGGGTSYRMSTVTRGSVTQTLTTTGTLSPIHAADLDFQVAGTVGRVRVKSGAHVKAGEVVAQLDRSTLRAALTSARSTLSDAQASLVSDETSQTSSSTSTSGSSSTGTRRTTGSPTPTASPTPTSGSGSGSGAGSGGSAASTPRRSPATRPPSSRCSTPRTPTLLSPGQR